jgi:hypothetical protein
MDSNFRFHEQAIRLSPRDTAISIWYQWIGDVHLLQSHTDEAILWLEKARHANPAHPLIRGWLASASGLKGETERAVGELAEARRLSSDGRFSSIANLKAAQYFGVPAVRALFEANLSRWPAQGRDARGVRHSPVASLNPLALVGLGGRLWLPETAGRGPAHPRWPPIHQNRNSRPATRPSAEAVDRNRRAERRSYEQVTVFFTTHCMEVHLADPAAHGISQSSTKLRPTAVSRVALAACRDTDQVWSPTHSLRNVEGCRVTAHLLVPGSTFTGMTARGRTEKPPGSWTPDQVIDVLVERMGKGDFYIICPDNDVTTDVDNRRILWGAEDIISNRPPLSRWHPDYADEFAAFLKAPSPFRE